MQPSWRALTVSAEVTSLKVPDGSEGERFEVLQKIEEPVLVKHPTTGNAVRAGTGEYLWARNLLANRLFDCPVVYLEPYRMNSEATYARIQAGDYEGEREVAGKMRRSIFREYADGIVAGVRAYYSSARQPSVPK